MELFPRQYNMIAELTRLEQLMPSYADVMNKLSKTVRRYVWDKSNIKALAYILYVCNDVFSVVVDVFGESLDFADMYVDMLDKHNGLYSGYSFKQQYDGVRAQIQVARTQELMHEHWKQLNPYFRKDYAPEDLLTKDLTEILEDFFGNVVDVFPDEFFIPLQSFDYLLRGRRGVWTKSSELEAPSLEVAIKNNIQNRWNPPGKRYLYLVAGNRKCSNNEQVCFAEMRVDTEEDVTISDFHVIDALGGGKIINLDYENVSRPELFASLEAEERNQVKVIMDEIIKSGSIPAQADLRAEMILSKIDMHSEETKRICAVFCGKLFLKELCDTIFVPLDKDEDSDPILKEKCYKSFHILAGFFEDHGIVGIVYPSTRMKLLGKKGTNLVLFDADAAKPDIRTFRVMHRSDFEI